MGEWQPIETAPTTGYILLSFSNYTLPEVGRYEVDENGDGAFYCGDDEKSCASFGLFVNGWMELPKCRRDEE